MSYYLLTIYGSDDFQTVIEDGEYRGEFPIPTKVSWMEESGETSLRESLSLSVKNDFDSSAKMARVLDRGVRFVGPLADTMQAKLHEILDTPRFLLEAQWDKPKFHCIPQLDHPSANQIFVSIEYFGPPKADVYLT